MKKMGNRRERTRMRHRAVHSKHLSDHLISWLKHSQWLPITHTTQPPPYYLQDSSLWFWFPFVGSPPATSPPPHNVNNFHSSYTEPGTLPGTLCLDASILFFMLFPSVGMSFFSFSFYHNSSLLPGQIAFLLLYDVLVF